jgi:iron complex transport system substrate-binding protein
MIMSQICWTCGRGSDAGEIIEEAGGQNIASGLRGDVPEVDPEWIIEQNPDVMVYHYIRPAESERAISPSVEVLESRRALIVSQPGFDGIRAVEEGRVCLVDMGIVTGPRQIVGLLHFAKWFHPRSLPGYQPRSGPRGDTSIVLRYG